MFADEIEAGAALLDEEMPGWELKIEIGELAMQDCHACIVGQAFLDTNWREWDSPYEIGLYKMALGDGEAHDLGFDLPKWCNDLLREVPSNKAEELRLIFFAKLGDEWGELIKERLDKGIDLS